MPDPVQCQGRTITVAQPQAVDIEVFQADGVTSIVTLNSGGTFSRNLFATAGGWIERP